MPAVVPIAAAAVGAGATIVAAHSASSAADKASQAQTQSNEAAIAEQRREYDQSRSDLAPWRQVGVGALQQLARTENIQLPADATSGASYGANTDTYQTTGSTTVNGKTVNFAQPTNPTSGTIWLDRSGGQPQLKVWDQSSNRWAIPNQQQASTYLGGADINSLGKTTATAGTTAATPYGDFKASPDYQFRFDQGERAVTGNMAAKGLLDSGATGHALINYGQGAASQEFGNWFDRISALAGVGQSATNSTVQAGQNSANNVSQILQNQGTQRASSIATQGGINAGLISGLGGTLSGLITNLGGPKPTTPTQPVTTPPINGGGGYSTLWGSVI